MLVHGDIARLPVRNERDDGMLGAPYLPYVNLDPGILVEVVCDDEPGLHNVHRVGDVAPVSLRDGDTEPCIRRIILDQAELERYTEPAKREIRG